MTCVRPNCANENARGYGKTCHFIGIVAIRNEYRKMGCRQTQLNLVEFGLGAPGDRPVDFIAIGLMKVSCDKSSGKTRSTVDDNVKIALCIRFHKRLPEAHVQVKKRV